MVDKFKTEEKALQANKEFLKFLAQRSRSTKRVSLAEARKRLGIS
ncbi:MAG TPA: hypothetical protein VK184_26050 [Nostocaceae cyanobacterium]|nr:hypothetical protein [Nostocaceae cyanobacterium]